MLSPNVNTTMTMLTELYNEMLSVDQYGIQCNSLSIGFVHPDLQWLITTRDRSSKLRDAMNGFMDKKPGIYADILYPFINYQTLFSAFAEASRNIKDKETWIEFLTPLRDSLSAAVTQTQSAGKEFSDAYRNVNALQNLLEMSVVDGWDALGNEEEIMTKIASQIGSLQTRIGNMGVNLTAADLRAGKSYTQTLLTMMYGIATSSVTSIPYLSFAGAIFTLGDSFYNIIKTSEEVRNDLDQLTELQTEATDAAQAAAVTKAVIQVLQKMLVDFIKLCHLPQLSLMWKDELHKIESAIAAINSGSDPSKYFDLQTMKIAAASWGTLSDFVNHIRKPLLTDKSVTVNYQHQIIQQ